MGIKDKLVDAVIFGAGASAGAKLFEKIKEELVGSENDEPKTETPAQKAKREAKERSEREAAAKREAKEAKKAAEARKKAAVADEAAIDAELAALKKRIKS